jgi:hypothetical protein
VPRAAPDGVDRRYHQRGAADGGVGLDGAGSERQFQRGGRFGTHSSNESFTPIYYKRLMFFAHFNAGVRAVDIRDPYHPREVAHFVPAITERTDQRCATVAGKEHCARVIQTNNVDVDERGYIYIVDRANTGMHILELAGAARPIANWPK